jgi:DNA replication and repair protein RecF
VSNELVINKINLVNFKNYRQVDIHFSPQINCFLGSNGAGKTNVLDAIYYLSMSKSYMNPVDSQNILFDEQFFVIQSEWTREQKNDQIYCGVKKGSKKVFKKNKVVYDKLADHIGLFPSVMISPYDRNLILEGSDVRRKWMDGIVSQFDKNFLHDLIKYGKVLEQRNALLKNMTSFGVFDRESIEVWNDQLIRYGETIYAGRTAFIQDFTPVFQKYYQWLANEKEVVALDYRSQLHEENLGTLLHDAEKNDKRKQYTTVGLHKDDLVFTIKNHPIKKFGSQGQQKTFLIALRLAQYEWLKTHLDVKPVLLLDDIFDKLDHHRVERLMKMVSDQDFGQVLITDTDEERINTIFNSNQIPFKAFRVQHNEIEELTTHLIQEDEREKTT